MTVAYALEALGIALDNAIRFSLAAKIDDSVTSELKHIRNVVEANKDKSHD